MKTIDEAANEYSCRKDNEYEAYSGFKSGVEFAQRWIPVEEELPTDIWIVVKNDYRYAATRISSDIDMKFVKSNFTHWRTIELK